MAGNSASFAVSSANRCCSEAMFSRDAQRSAGFALRCASRLNGTRDLPMSAITVPEHNVTGIDYADCRHLRYTGPALIDMHAHVMRPRNFDKPDVIVEDNLDQARLMLNVADEFSVERIYTMCPADDIPLLRRAFGDRLGFNGPI